MVKRTDKKSKVAGMKRGKSKTPATPPQPKESNVMRMDDYLPLAVCFDEEDVIGLSTFDGETAWAIASEPEIRGLLERKAKGGDAVTVSKELYEELRSLEI